MNKILLALTLFVFLQSVSFAQKSKSSTVLTIDENKFSLEEFMYVYNKNNTNSSKVESKNVDDYMNLYVNFRLKVKEAEDRGMDTSAAFIKELAGYRTQLAKPYLTDKSVDEDILKEAYERLQWDLRASHIMISVPEDASKNDSVSLAAYKKLIDIRKQIIDGADFVEMAKKYSDDPSAKDHPAGRNRGASKGNGGDLGYFTAFYMVYPFETAAYNTKVGDICMPIRTKYGYHIIKVTDRIPELGKIEVKHINVKPEAPTEAANAKAQAKIKEIEAKIKSGSISFEEAAKLYSDDKGSADKGGLLPAFEVSRMVPEFIETISKLKIDEVSGSVRTNYGWHLVKLVKLVKIPSYENYLSTLRTKVARDSRSNKSKEAAIEKFKKDYSFKEYSKNLIGFYDAIDSTIFSYSWTADKASSFNKVMFKLDRKKYTQQDFAKYVEKNQRTKKRGTKRFIVDDLYKLWTDNTILDYKDSKLEEENIDFKMLMQEYHDGILLFSISDEEVWGKAVRDTTGLKKFYELNKEKYQWKERTDAVIYKCSTDSMAKLVVKWLGDSLSLDSIIRLANKNSSLNLHFERGKYEPETNEIIDQAKKEVGVSNVIEQGKTFYIADIKELLPAQAKSIDEARGLITADYQNFLEKQWVEKLHKEHTVIINNELLQKI